MVFELSKEGAAPRHKVEPRQLMPSADEMRRKAMRMKMKRYVFSGFWKIRIEIRYDRCSEIVFLLMPFGWNHEVIWICG